MMDLQNENPVTLAGAHRAWNFDRHILNDKPDTNEIAGESLAVRLVSQRYRITVSRARTICELAGIGGGA